MRNGNRLFILVMVIAILIVTNLTAQTLPVDSRRIPMQQAKTFEVLKYSPAADTTWHRITLRTNTVEVVILPITGNVDVRTDSLYTNNYFFGITAGVPLKMPTYKGTKFYIRRTAAATASVANIIFYKM